MIVTTYPKGFSHILKGDVKLDGLHIKALLLKNSYTYANAQEFVNDLTPASNEVSGGGYARQTVSLTITVAGDEVTVAPSAALTFTALTATVRYAVIYQEVNNDSDSLLLFCFDLGRDMVLTASNLTLHVNNLVEGLG